MDIKQLYEIYRKHPVVTTDSRDCKQGSIFIALKGENFDGNRFAKSALDKGCSYVVIDEPEFATPGDERFIVVPDTLTAYKELAREHRRQFNIPVIGITGTNGKTTTKELVSAVLAEKYNVMHTEGNFNNDVGVPRTLLTLNATHDIAVVEMGASHPGDIKKLVEYVEPTCGLITNVGHAHLQGFGSFEGVKKTKGELYDFLAAHNGLLFLNEQNEDLVQMAAERNFGRVISYGQTADVNVSGTVTACNPFLNFTWQQNLKQGGNEPVEQHTHLIGSYNIDNMLAAAAVGLYFGVSVEQIHHALDNYVPTNNRSQFVQTASNRLIVDAYNANPSSMKVALDSFALAPENNKMLILGDMRELGADSQKEHQALVDRIANEHLADVVWLVGPEFGRTDTAFRKFSDVEQVKKAIAEEQPHDMYILIKGSNSTHLYELPKLL